MIVLALAAVLGISCGSEPNSAIAKSEIKESDRARLPVVTLPPVDFGQETKSAVEEDTPMALGTPIPAAEFIVRFEGKRRPDKLHFQHNFSIQVRTRQGGLAEIASCVVKPIGRLDQDVVMYQGICKKPNRDRGECVIEVCRGKSYLVRSAQIQK